MADMKAENIEGGAKRISRKNCVSPDRDAIQASTPRADMT